MFKTTKSSIIFIFILILASLLFGACSLYTYFAEIAEIGEDFISVTLTNLTYSSISFILTFLTAFLFAYIWMIWLKRNLSSITLTETIFEKKFLITGVSVLAGILGALMFTKEISKDILLALNSTSMDVADPIFGNDISYYMLVRPLMITVRSFLNNIVTVLLILTVVSYYYYISRSNETFSYKSVLYEKKAITHIIITALLLFAVKILGYKFTMEDLLFKGTDRVGGGYVDINIWLKFYQIMPIILLLIILFSIFFVYKSKYKALIGTIAVYPLCFIITGVIAFGTQQLIVKPSESMRESQYISYNIEATRNAYNLSNITESEYPLNDSITAETLEKNSDIVENIRITDHAATLTAYNQLQGIRNYYQFVDADVVPYTENGKRKASFMSVRELSDTGDLSNATYVNKHMKYTHGFGIVKSPVDKVTPEGQPDFLIKDIPLTYKDTNVEVTQPRIYFGEGYDNYFIVNTKQSELDFADASTEYEYSYDGTAGIKLTPLNRIIYSIKQGDINLLTSSYITNESRLLLNHNALNRVKKVVPFLTFDSDIHIAVDSDGTLKWIIDGYTHSKYYPYSQYYNGTSFNYIRNSVKATVDAYSGEVKLYIIDENDPIIASYKKIYPDIFTEDKMNDALRQQIKYPEWLFGVQANIFTKYHTTNPATFYSGSDIWEVAREKYGEGPDITNVSPYYNVTKLGDDETEFIIMIPYTLKNKDNNLVGWLAARNDGENYGKFVSYSFPIGKHAYGTLQIENKIDNDPDISREITLWSQGGSSVMRGNMMVVPLNQSLIYVEPLYITSQNEASLPEVKRIIVAYEDNIVMETSLKNAFNKLFGEYESTLPPIEDVEDIVTSPDVLESIKSEYKALKDAAARGDWEQFGKSMEIIDNLLY